MFVAAALLGIGAATGVDAQYPTAYDMKTIGSSKAMSARNGWTIFTVTILKRNRRILSARGSTLRHWKTKRFACVA
jgi:hypothetical protein